MIINKNNQDVAMAVAIAVVAATIALVNNKKHPPRALWVESAAARCCQL